MSPPKFDSVMSVGGKFAEGNRRKPKNNIHNDV